MTKQKQIWLPLLASALVIAGCGKRVDESTPTRQPTPVPSALTAIFGSVTAPDNLLAIPELRLRAKPGDEVVLEAKVMGTQQPFVENRSIVVVGDEGTMTSCDILHGDDCPTPWDNCCDKPDVVRAGTVTIQVVDEDGNVLRSDIKGVSGLKELSRVRIAGEVAPISTEAAFIVNATRIEIR